MPARDDLIFVPAGTLLRGTPSEEIDRVVARHADLALPRGYFAKETPRTAVEVPAFWIGRVPITVADDEEHGRDVGATPVPGPADVPVVVSYERALGFCAWLSERWDAPVGIPTETQWERAARGDDDREYPWGDEFDPTRANLAEAGVGAMTPVGSFPTGASPFGILDLAGNADEWTSTPYAPYPGADAEVPAVEEWATDPHVTRGGSYFHGRDLARCARRHALYPPLDTAGFRIVVPAD